MESFRGRGNPTAADSKAMEYLIKLRKRAENGEPVQAEYRRLILENLKAYKPNKSKFKKGKTKEKSEYNKKLLEDYANLANIQASFLTANQLDAFQELKEDVEKYPQQKDFSFEALRKAGLNQTIDIVDKSTKLSKFVARDIIQHTSFNEIILATEYWIDVAYSLVYELDVKNFHDAYSIIAGLNQSIITTIRQRAKNAEVEILSKEGEGKFEELNKLFSSHNQFANIRKAIASNSKENNPFIPYLGMYQTDILLTIEGENGKIGKLTEQGEIEIAKGERSKKVEEKCKSLREAISLLPIRNLEHSSSENMRKKLDEVDPKLYDGLTKAQADELLNPIIKANEEKADVKKKISKSLPAILKKIQQASIASPKEEINIDLAPPRRKESTKQQRDRILSSSSNARSSQPLMHKAQSVEGPVSRIKKAVGLGDDIKDRLIDYVREIQKINLKFRPWCLKNNIANLLTENRKIIEKLKNKEVISVVEMKQLKDIKEKIDGLQVNGVFNSLLLEEAKLKDLEGDIIELSKNNENILPLWNELVGLADSKLDIGKGVKVGIYEIWSYYSDVSDYLINAEIEGLESLSQNLANIQKNMESLKKQENIKKNEFSPPLEAVCKEDIKKYIENIQLMLENERLTLDDNVLTAFMKSFPEPEFQTLDDLFKSINETINPSHPLVDNKIDPERIGEFVDRLNIIIENKKTVLFDQAGIYQGEMYLKLKKVLRSLADKVNFTDKLFYNSDKQLIQNMLKALDAFDGKEKTFEPFGGEFPERNPIKFLDSNMFRNEHFGDMLHFYFNKNDSNEKVIFHDYEQLKNIHDLAIFSTEENEGLNVYSQEDLSAESELNDSIAELSIQEDEVGQAQNPKVDQARIPIVDSDDSLSKEERISKVEDNVNALIKYLSGTDVATKATQNAGAINKFYREYLAPLILVGKDGKKKLREGVLDALLKRKVNSRNGLNILRLIVKNKAVIDTISSGHDFDMQNLFNDFSVKMDVDDLINFLSGQNAVTKATEDGKAIQTFYNDYLAPLISIDNQGKKKLKEGVFNELLSYNKDSGTQLNKLREIVSNDNVVRAIFEDQAYDIQALLKGFHLQIDENNVDKLIEFLSNHDVATNDEKAIREFHEKYLAPLISIDNKGTKKLGEGVLADLLSRNITNYDEIKKLREIVRSANVYTVVNKDHQYDINKIFNGLDEIDVDELINFLKVYNFGDYEAGMQIYKNYLAPLMTVVDGEKKLKEGVIDKLKARIGTNSAEIEKLKQIMGGTIVNAVIFDEDEYDISELITALDSNVSLTDVPSPPASGNMLDSDDEELVQEFEVNQGDIDVGESNNFQAIDEQFSSVKVDVDYLINFLSKNDLKTNDDKKIKEFYAKYLSPLIFINDKWEKNLKPGVLDELRSRNDTNKAEMGKLREIVKDDSVEYVIFMDHAFDIQKHFNALHSNISPSYAPSSFDSSGSDLAEPLKRPRSLSESAPKPASLNIEGSTRARSSSSPSSSSDIDGRANPNKFVLPQSTEEEYAEQQREQAKIQAALALEARGLEEKRNKRVIEENPVRLEGDEELVGNRSASPALTTIIATWFRGLFGASDKPSPIAEQIELTEIKGKKKVVLPDVSDVEINNFVRKNYSHQKSLYDRVAALMGNEKIWTILKADAKKYGNNENHEFFEKMQKLITLNSNVDQGKGSDNAKLVRKAWKDCWDAHLKDGVAQSVNLPSVLMDQLNMINDNMDKKIIPANLADILIASLNAKGGSIVDAILSEHSDVGILSRINKAVKQLEQNKNTASQLDSSAPNRGQRSRSSSFASSSISGASLSDSVTSSSSSSSVSTKPGLFAGAAGSRERSSSVDASHVLGARSELQASRARASSAPSSVNVRSSSSAPQPPGAGMQPTEESGQSAPIQTRHPDESTALQSSMLSELNESQTNGVIFYGDAAKLVDDKGLSKAVNDYLNSKTPVKGGDGVASDGEGRTLPFEGQARCIYLKVITNKYTNASARAATIQHKVNESFRTESYLSPESKINLRNAKSISGRVKGNVFSTKIPGGEAAMLLGVTTVGNHFMALYNNIPGNEGKKFDEILPDDRAAFSNKHSMKILPGTTDEHQIGILVTCRLLGLKRPYGATVKVKDKELDDMAVLAYQKWPELIKANGIFDRLRPAGIPSLAEMPPFKANPRNGGR